MELAAGRYPASPLGKSECRAGPRWTDTCKGRKMRYLITFSAMLALSACATPEQRLQTGLYDAGLSKPVSACMASKMVHQLSLVELQRLQSLASLKETHIRDLTVAELFHKVRALNDGHILSVTTTAGLSCAIDSTR